MRMVNAGRGAVAARPSACGASRVVASIIVSAVASAGSGCLAERSIPVRPGDVAATRTAVAAIDVPDDASTREWLVRTHAGLRILLPHEQHDALLTDDLHDGSGRPADVFTRLGRDPERLNSVVHNLDGIIHSVQAIAVESSIEEPAPPWPGFEDVWIPVSGDVSLSGRLGTATEYGHVVERDCIVILPGLWGDHGVTRTRDLALALRRAGFHVLSLELRGHGQTEARFPHIPYTFGVLDVQDLLRVSAWLEDQPHVRRTGLAAFCWGGNLALLAAWLDGREEGHPSITPRVAAFLDPPPERTHFAAGILTFSPVLRWEELVDTLDRPLSIWEDGGAAFFQMTVKHWMERKSVPRPDGSLRRFIKFSFAHSVFTAEFPQHEGYQFLTLLPYRDQPSGDKLESARVPVLIVHAVNDMLTSAQDVADLIAMTDNRNVAALVLPGGGHIGFAPYARTYYYALIKRFFDPHQGAAADSILGASGPVKNVAIRQAEGEP